MPQTGDAHVVVGLELGVQLRGLPIPDKQLAVRVARDQVAGRTTSVVRAGVKNFATMRLITNTNIHGGTGLEISKNIKYVEIQKVLLGRVSKTSQQSRKS